ncbi:MAG: hypothetical protein ACREPZ_12465, partial [Rhodanobacteraceae bacterium]
GGNRYDLVFETLAEQVDLPRHDRNHSLDGYIHRYAARLAHYLQEAPYNWFNFYDFWQPQSAADAQPVVEEALQHAQAS